MSREEALDIIYKGIFDTISAGYNAAMDRKRQKALQGFEAAKRNMKLYTGYGDDESTPEPATQEVVSAPRVATPTMPSLPPPPPQDAEFEEVSSQSSPITDENRMLPYKVRDPFKENTSPSLTSSKPKQLPPPKDMYEDTTGGPIEADEMKEMAKPKDPAHDKAFDDSYSAMMEAINRAINQSYTKFNQEGRKAGKEARLQQSKDMKDAVEYFDKEKKKTQPKIKPAIDPKTAKKGANKTKPAPIEKPKAASEEGKKALKTRSVELTKPKADDAKMKYAEYTKNIQNKNTRDEWVKENMDRIKDAGFYDVLPDKYKTGNEEPKKATEKKKTKRNSDDEAKRAMGL